MLSKHKKQDRLCVRGCCGGVTECACSSADMPLTGMNERSVCNLGRISPDKPSSREKEATLAQMVAYWGQDNSYFGQLMARY